MTAAWRREDGTQLPSLFRRNVPTVKAVGDLDTEGSSGSTSVGLNDLLLTHRQAHRALAGTSVLALVVAAVALTYLMVTCMRHLSRGFKFSNQQSRHLASNFPDEEGEACQGPPGDDGELETEAEDAEGVEPEGAAAAPLPEEQLGALGPAPAAPAGQTRRVLPPVTLGLVERTMLLLEQPVAILTPLIPILRPDQSLALVRNLARLAVLELSAFASVPPCLQPVRQRVTQAYVDLIQYVLTEEPTSTMALQKKWNTSLRNLQLLLERIAGVPPETENLTVDNYRLIIENQQRLCHWTSSQVLNIMHAIAEVKTDDPTQDSDDAVLPLDRVLTSLFTVRRLQVLNNFHLRGWLKCHQRSIATPVIFTRDLLNKARFTPMGNILNKIDAITYAVISAGGQPASQYAPLLLSVGEQQVMLQHQALMQQLGHQQHPGPPHPLQPQAYGPDPMGPFARQPAQQAHPLMQPVPQAPIAPPPQAAQGAAQASFFDPAAQDMQFPAVNPDPQISGQQQPPAPSLQIQLPSIYQYSYGSPLQPDEPSTSSSGDASSEADIGAASAPSQPSSTSDQPQTPHTGTNEESSSDDDDA
ncbi:hypothetical protein Emed_005585 [Eimeria media]